MGSEAVVSVKDTGIGISAEMLPRVFDLFTQVEGSIDRAQGGLGIGLTLVRKLVAMHGGRVSAASEGAGRGSEFTIQIPIAATGDDASTSDDALASDDAPALEPAPADKGARCRVLVVDDSADTARALARLLEESGHVVATAGDGRSAVEFASASSPDLVLLDIRLPDTNGFTLVERLRAMPGLDQAVFIAISGFAQEQDPQRARDAGFDYFLIKPVNIDTLLAIADEAARVKTSAGVF